MSRSVGLSFTKTTRRSPEKVSHGATIALAGCDRSFGRTAGQITRTSIVTTQTDMSQGLLDERGPICTTSSKQHVADRAVVDDREDDKPYSGKTTPKAQLYGDLDASSLDRWLESLSQEAEPPTEEQA